MARIEGVLYRTRSGRAIMNGWRTVIDFSLSFARDYNYSVE